MQFNGKEYPFSFVKDITERKLAEQEIADSNKLSRRIIESVDEGVIVLGVDSRIKVWNPYMERLTGLSLNEVLGKPPEELFPRLYETIINERVKKILDGQTPDQLDLPYHFPASGRSGWLWETNAPLHNTKGEKIGIIITCGIPPNANRPSRLCGTPSFPLTMRLSRYSGYRRGGVSVTRTRPAATSAIHGMNCWI